MKHLNSIIVAACFLCIISACGGNKGKANDADSTITKIDTTVNPADHTNAAVSDTTKPQGAVGLDTVAGGTSSSSGIKKDSSKHKKH